MTDLGWLVVLSVATFTGLALAFRRANELFCLEARDGAVRVLRGRIPRPLLQDLSDVLARAGGRVRVRAMTEGGRPALRIDGALSADDAQRLRNVLGQWTVAQIRTR